MSQFLAKNVFFPHFGTRRNVRRTLYPRFQKYSFVICYAYCWHVCLSRTWTLLGKHPGVLEKIKVYLFHKRLNTAPLRRADVICLGQAGKMEFGCVGNEGLNMSWSCSGKQKGMEENKERTGTGWKAAKEKKRERREPRRKAAAPGRTAGVEGRGGAAGRAQPWLAAILASSHPVPTLALKCRIIFNIILSAPPFKNDKMSFVVTVTAIPFL